MTASPSALLSRIRVGVSSCLFGERVRYDGGHKRDSLLVERMGQYIEWMPICPEVEAGFGVPREPVELVRQGAMISMRGRETRQDFTDAMTAWTRAKMQGLASANLCGYVFKSKSPSCGINGVPVAGDNAARAESGTGLFATAVMMALPNLPVIDELALHDNARRADFIRQICANARTITAVENLSNVNVAEAALLAIE